jgi:copper homeostasis protein
MPIAFHRAIDRCANIAIALEQLIELGFVRILTSGAAPTAFEGKDTIAKMVAQAKGRIEIMPGAGINPSNIGEIKSFTGATTFHSSARIKLHSKMQFTNQLGGEDYQYEQTSNEIVERLIIALK